ncbi:hypothetical protein [Hyalangium sp.]|uniref:hypothetical protein n=1 Tax=Hyalangium sp. TaxID=2028555 RepID=UPI002D5AEC6A|nr:hypothetical protein [Hyalangium sp.]HYI01803.1 hypothetical protein [Hyalangium sp.]
MSVLGARCAREVVVLLGARGLLASLTARALREAGFSIVAVGRAEPHPLGVDVTREEAWQPAFWSQLLGAARGQGGSPRAIINFVTCKQGPAETLQQVNLAGVRALVAAATAAREQGAHPLTLHLGSAAEHRPERDARGYAGAKREAHAYCLTTPGVDVVLTLGIVQRTPSPAPAFVRFTLRHLPALAAVPVKVCSAEDVAQALVALVRHPVAPGEPPPASPSELWLEGREARLGELFGIAPHPVRARTWEPWMLRALATLRGEGFPWLARLGGFARIALGRAPNHYLGPAPGTAPTPSTELRELMSPGRWRILPFPRSADHVPFVRAAREAAALPP